MTAQQSKALHVLLRKQNILGPTKHEYLSETLGRAITSANELTTSEASWLIDHLQEEGVPA